MHKKIYIVIIVVLFLLIVMSSQLILGHNSIPHQKEVEKEIAAYQAQIDSLTAIIEHHNLEIEKLKKDSLYKEHILRTRYGMSRKGEKVFQLVE